MGMLSENGKDSLKFHLAQVWDAASGSKQFTFAGHEAAVHSVCPHHKENIQVLTPF